MTLLLRNMYGFIPPNHIMLLLTVHFDRQRRCIGQTEDHRPSLVVKVVVRTVVDIPLSPCLYHVEACSFGWCLNLSFQILKEGIYDAVDMCMQWHGRTLSCYHKADSNP